MDRGSMTITEVSEGGTVPELKVKNDGDVAVVLLDGEEVAGAKQNRVLNTTILIAAKTETVIPVSCTEHGRWGYTSRTFDDSGTVMAARVRSRKAASVTENLRTHRSYRSNQGEVWDGIAEMSADLHVNSPTGAMRDAFTARARDLDTYIKAIPLGDHQRGSLFFINGSVVGLDCLSRSSAYAVLHPKLVKSYAVEAILARKGEQKEVSVQTAQAFLEGASGCSGKKYKSVGLGWDHRLEGEKIVGSALEHEDHVIHMAFFPMEASEKIDPMAGFRRRRAYRV